MVGTVIISLATLVGAVVGMVSTLVQAVVVGAAMAVAAVSGPWGRSDGGEYDDVGGGPAGSLEGSPEPVFRRFLYSFMVVFGTDST